jgi:hypothetical protein
MPFKDFQVGQTLTSAEVDDFLMRQAVMVFDDSSQRASELGTAVAEGMVTYLKDTDTVEQYNGTLWGPVGTDSFTTIGTAGNILYSNGTAGVLWASNGTTGQTIISAGTAGITAVNTISPFLLLGV